VVLVLAVLTGGALGVSAALGLLLVIAVMLLPGALLTSVAFTWLARGQRHPGRGATGWLCGAISALIFGFIYGLMALSADPGPDPWSAFDHRPLLIFLAAVAGIIGMISGSAMAAAVEDSPTEPT
jgi:hypothetical protein